MTGVAWLVPAAPAVFAVVALLLGRRLPGGRGGGVARRHRGRDGGRDRPAARARLATPTPTVVHQWSYAPLSTRPAASACTSVRPSTGCPPCSSVMVCVVVAAGPGLLDRATCTAIAGCPSYFAWVSLFTAAMLLVVLSERPVRALRRLGGHGHLLLPPGRSLPRVARRRTRRHQGVPDHPARRRGVPVRHLRPRHGRAQLRDRRRDERFRRCRTARSSAGTLLLLGGVVGKSAQFPLQTWLPDAMAGPTPVSALIHAATMVAAGVFVVARLYPDFAASPVTMTRARPWSRWSRCCCRALAALVQDDLKRVLAWSTVSQLAYMTAGLAVGGYQPALFHLINHAAFKALLFLAAGSVLHAVGTNLMSEMGGLWRRMPITFGDVPGRRAGTGRSAAVLRRLQQGLDPRRRPACCLGGRTPPPGCRRGWGSSSTPPVWSLSS